MAITFAVRGDSEVPRFVSVPTQTVPFKIGADTLPASISSSDTGLIGSKILDVQHSTQAYRSIRYIGYGNIPDFTTGFSSIARVIPRYSTAPSGNNRGALFQLSGIGSQPYLALQHQTDGTIKVIATDATLSSIMLNMTSVSTWSPTAGTVYDIVLTWDGTTTANALKIYVDGSLLVQGNASINNNFLFANGACYSEIKLANSQNQGFDGDFDFEEMVLLDEVIDPNSVGLTSGNGSLNGASRTEFVDVAESNGLPSSGNSVVSVGSINF